MSINLDYKKEKVDSTYKTIYIKNELVEKIDELAKKNNTSFNNVIIKMIEYCTGSKNKF